MDVPLYEITFGDYSVVEIVAPTEANAIVRAQNKRRLQGLTPFVGRIRKIKDVPVKL